MAYFFYICYVTCKHVSTSEVRSTSSFALSRVNMAKRCVVLFAARTVLFFLVSCYKKMSLLVEALPQIATARTTATSTTTILIIARVKTQENTNELFKYAKYITGCRRNKMEKKKDWKKVD